MTDEQRYHQLLVDAICGVGFPTMTLGSECEKTGLAEFTGNQWNPAWKWDRKALFHVPVEQLQELYQGLCDARDETFIPTDPVDDFPGIIMPGVN